MISVQVFTSEELAAAGLRRAVIDVCLAAHEDDVFRVMFTKYFSSGARHFLVRWRMTSRIVLFERPGRFRDVMERGPFAHFEHDHEFVRRGERTVMLDRLAFASPLGVLGRIADALVMRRHLARLLAVRADAIRTCAESALGDRFLGLARERAQRRPSSTRT